MEPRHKATVFLWVGVLLAVSALLFPWGLKHVEEEQCRCDGEDAYYRLTGIEIHRETTIGDEVHRDAYFESYYDHNPNHNLPGGELLENVSAVMGLGVLVLGASAVAHGFRPRPRRRRVAVWIVAVAGSLYAAAVVVTIAAMGLHASGWRAFEVGPFIPWVGSWLAIIAVICLYKAILAFDLVPRAAQGMPSLPSEVQARDQ